MYKRPTLVCTQAKSERNKGEMKLIQEHTWEPEKKKKKKKKKRKKEKKKKKKKKIRQTKKKQFESPRGQLVFGFAAKIYMESRTGEDGKNKVQITQPL